MIGEGSGVTITLSPDAQVVTHFLLQAKMWSTSYQSVWRICIMVQRGNWRCRRTLSVTNVKVAVKLKRCSLCF